MYIGHILAVPKAARWVASDQNMRPATTFSRLQEGSLVGARWTLSCSSRNTSESYISEYTRSLSSPPGRVRNSLKGVRWNCLERWLSNASLINVTILRWYSPGILNFLEGTCLLPDGTSMSISACWKERRNGDNSSALSAFWFSCVALKDCRASS